MANLSEAFSGGISPIQQMQVYDWNKETLLQKGYKQFTSDEGDLNLCLNLYNLVQTIQNFFWERMQLVGVDGQGATPPFLVHLPQWNAYYHPKLKHFAFNGILTATGEVVAHEYTHAVIDHLKPLKYEGESGAIDESIADVVGIVFKRNVLMKNDWKIGELRDLSNPKSMENFNRDLAPRFDANGDSTNDMGHVHENSGILSHAFFLASQELARSNADAGDKLLLGVWLKSVTELEDQIFKGFVEKTIAIAESYGFAKFAVTLEPIKMAWRKVGLLQ